MPNSKAKDVFAAMAYWPHCRHGGRYDPDIGPRSGCGRCLIRWVCGQSFAVLIAIGAVLVAIGIAGDVVPWALTRIGPLWRSLDWTGKALAAGVVTFIAGVACGVVGEG